MAADRLRRVGWGELVQGRPTRGPVGDTWVDADEVLALCPARSSYNVTVIHLRGGDRLEVQGKVAEVLRQLT